MTTIAFYREGMENEKLVLPMGFHVERGEWKKDLPMGNPPFASGTGTLFGDDLVFIPVYDFTRHADGECYNDGPGLIRREVFAALREWLLTEPRAEPEVIEALERAELK